jgi:DNA polymerase-3 subunit delta'
MWNSIVGHSVQMKRLEHDILNGDVHHAYLFSGPAEIGKTVVAKAFASYLQTGVPESNEVTEAISNMSHPDTFFYSADDGTFKVSQVRDIIERLSRSFSSPYHICIIENVERMTISASNALLKILEEPPNGTVFILTSEKANKLLPTLVSRTRNVRFSDISRQTLLHYLEGLDEPQLSVKQIETMLELSDGKMGRIFRFIHQSDYLEEYSKLYDSVLQCLKSEDIVTRFRFVEDLLKSQDVPRMLELFFQALSHIVRVMMREKVANNEAWRVRDLYSSLERSRRLIYDTNVNKRLLLENLMLSL